MPNQKWDISRLSAGERSALKRNAGVMMNMASMKAIAAFYHAKIAVCKPEKLPFWFSALCMECLWREADDSKPFPEMLRSMYQSKEATESTKNRCIAFLDFVWSNDGFLLGKICALARRMRSENPNVLPDFEALADDLERWNYADRHIQKKWLLIICGDRENPPKEEEKKRAD